MGEIGHFGKDLIFRTSDKRVLTFDSFTQKVSGRWGTHNIIGSTPHKEYSGPGSRKVSFKMSFDALCGVKPRAMLELLENLIENGTVDYLVIGGRRIGNNRFYISDMSEAWDVVYGGGELERATVSVTLEEYV